MAIGNTIQRARKAALRISQGGFSVELTLTPNYTNTIFVDGLENPYVDGTGAMYTPNALPELGEIKIQGLGTRHRTTYDPDTGLPMVGVNAHCTFSEKDLNERGYATRNQQGHVIVKNWLVSFQTDIGFFKYKIERPIPDESLGLIKCILGDYA